MLRMFHEINKVNLIPFPAAAVFEMRYTVLFKMLSLTFIQKWNLWFKT